MPPPVGPADPPPADFRRDLARSRLLPAARVEELFASAPPNRKWEPAAFADLLVQLGELTRFQAEKLLAGHWKGLSLGAYRLLCPLGRGGMGMVYLARAGAADGDAVPAGQLVALKVLPPHRAREEPRTRERFLREIGIGRQLPVHPALTRTLAAGELSGVLHVVMEFVPGRTVRQVLTDDGPLTVARTARVFADVAAGLHRAHLAGVVHRDLKPSNVIVTPGGRGKLLDFGFALVKGEPAPADPAVLGGPGYTLGTLDYLPPEQAADASAVGPAADLYALGCSLFHAVTGSPPFPGGTPAEKLRWHRTDAPSPVGQLNPSVPAGFARVIEQLMAKRPEARPASADEAARMLAPWAEPVRPVPLGQVGPTDAELLKQAEARWLAHRDAAADPEESLSLDVVEDATPLPVPATAPPVVRPPLVVPMWVVAAVAGAMGLFFIFLCVVGVLVVRWLR